MAQSTLIITFTELKAEIGRFLGYDRTVGNWTSDQVLDLTAILKRGLRQFYFPPRTYPIQVAGRKVVMPELAHRWSFLRPLATLDIWDDVVTADAITQSASSYSDPVTTITASDDVFYPSMEEKTIVYGTSGSSFVIDEYVSATQVKVTGDATGEDGNIITIDSGDVFTLPWDFGGMIGDGKFTYDVNENKLASIEITHDARVRQLRTGSVAASTPYLAAIVPLSADGTQGQRWGAMFHPPPNDVLTLHYRYYILADALVDSTAEYPYGSVAHSETILESCLAIAELREKDDSSTTHQDRFKELLQASIDHDNRLGDTVVHFGYCGDNSDGADEGKVLPTRHNSLVTYNGVEY